MLKIVDAAVDRLILADGTELPLGSVPEGKFLKRVSGLFVGADPPSGGGGGGSGEMILRTTDGPDVSDTTFVTDVGHAYALAVGTRILFHYEEFYTAGLDAGIKVGLVVPSGTDHRFWTPSNVKAAPTQTAVRNVVGTSSADYFDLSGQGSVLMVADIRGLVLNVTTAGWLQLRHAANVGGYSQPARLKANSILRVWPLA